MSEFILGPQVPIGSTYFDTTQIAKARIHGAACPVDPPPRPIKIQNETDDAYNARVQAWADGPLNSFTLLHYYDLPMNVRGAYARTNDLTLLSDFRKSADSWWKHPTWIDEGRVSVHPDNLGPPPRHAGIGGLILRALDGRPEMWPWIVNYTQVHLVTWCKLRINDSQLWYGPREVAFSMQYAAWVAKELIDSFPNVAQIRAQLITDLENLVVNYTGRLQYPDGSWRDSSEWLDNVFCALSADAAQGTTQLKVDPLSFPLATGQKVSFWNGGVTKTTKSQATGSTVIDVEPLPVSRIKNDFLSVDDGTMVSSMQPFIVGLLTSALVDVHQVINEPAKENCKNQILKACRHLYSDGPYAKDLIDQRSGRRVRGFHYFYHGGTTLNPTKYDKGSMAAPWTDYEGWWLMGNRQAISTILPAFAYAFKLSGDVYFKDAYNEMYDSAYNGTDGARAFLDDAGAKNYNQHARRVPASLAWIGGISLPPTTPPPAPTPTPPSPSPTTPGTPSPDGFKGTTIIDSAGGTWTIGAAIDQKGNGPTLRNDKPMGGVGSIYKFVSGVVYVLGTDANWYKWAGAWSSVGAQEPGGTSPTPQPPAPAPTPTPTPSDPTIGSLKKKVAWGKSDAQRKAKAKEERALGYYFYADETGDFAIFIYTGVKLNI